MVVLEPATGVVPAQLEQGLPELRREEEVAQQLASSVDPASVLAEEIKLARGVAKSGDPIAILATFPSKEISAKASR